jgi:hypothetical protein
LDAGAGLEVFVNSIDSSELHVVGLTGLYGGFGTTTGFQKVPCFTDVFENWYRKSVIMFSIGV